VPNVRRYMIEITEVETGRLVVFTAAGWTDNERRAAVAQILRLAGVPDGGRFIEADKPKGNLTRLSLRARFSKRQRA
jgi:hypothetical protein